MDAVDALICFGYQVVRNGILEKTQYRLCGERADLHFKQSIELLLKEVRENAQYYAKEIIKRGNKL